MRRAAKLAVGALIAGAGVAVALGREEPAPPPEPVGPPPGVRVRVEVLNAGGVPGAARAATMRLRDVGFDVVQWGNARSFDRDTSVVLDRVGRPELAAAVANALEIPNVLTEPDSNLYLEVSVLLGRDWTARTAPEPDPAEAAEPGLDPAGWLDR